jgi:hypothetical protein
MNDDEWRNASEGKKLDWLRETLVKMDRRINTLDFRLSEVAGGVHQLRQDVEALKKREP